MFGEYHCTVDKGRVFIPSKYRHHFKPGLQLALDEQRRFIANCWKLPKWKRPDWLKEMEIKTKEVKL